VKRRLLSWCLLGVGLARLLSGASPSGGGELRGTWRAPGADAPAVNWSAQLRAESATTVIEVSAEAPAGLALELSLVMPRESGVAGTWELQPSRVRLGPWRTTLARWWGDWPAGLSLDGELRAAGRGPWPLAADPTMGVSAELQGQALEISWPEHDLELRDGAGEARLAAEGTGRVQLSFPSGRVGDWTLGPSTVRFERPAVDGPWWLQEGGTTIAGGRVELAPMAWVPDAPELALRLRVRAVDLAALSAMWGEVLREAVGRVEGEIEVRRTGAGDWTVASGQLRLMTDQPAHVFLRASPGLLTADLPAKHPARDPLQRIELGRTALSLKRLDVTLRGEGPADGVPLRLRLELEPRDPGLIAPIVLDVNVRGAIDELWSLGTRRAP
jgi:hypothetical protein